MFETRTFTHGRWRGEISAARLGDLPALIGALEKEVCEKVIKEGHARKVWVTTSPAGPICVKEYKYPHTPDVIAMWLRGSRARREWKSQIFLASKSVPVPQPVIWAEGITAGGLRRSVVASEYVTPSLPLSDLLDGKETVTGTEKRLILESLGNALALLHRAGGRHDDAHPGNLLLDCTPGHPKVLVMDLHEVALKRRLSWRERLKNLGQFLGGLSSKISVYDKQRCLDAYLEALPDWTPAFPNRLEARRSMGRAVEFYARRYYRWHWRSRIAKCQEEGKRFHRLVCGDYTGWIRASWDTPKLREALSDPNALIVGSHAKAEKDGDTTTVARVAWEGLPGPLFVKRYNRKDLWERTKNLFRRSRAVRVWRSAYALEILGIPTPETVCVLERRKGPLLLEAFLTTRWIDGGVGLDDFYLERFGGPGLDVEAQREKREIEKRVAALFRELHGHRISHGDLKGRNVLLDPGQPAPFSPQLVDLDAMTLRPVRFKRARINDLSRLLFSVYRAASLLACARFLRDYSRTEPEIWDNRRDWWKAILKRTRRKLAEKGVTLDAR
jgi:tRNA A-37 threonylcarbamoyl transferase component Bud32